MTALPEDFTPPEGFNPPAPSTDWNRGFRRESFYWKHDPRFAAFRAAIKTILTYPRELPWTVQGFGFLRTYFSDGTNAKRFRLNVWDAALAVPNVSIVHDHPWAFTSYIISGNFYNTRMGPSTELHEDSARYSWMMIKTGESGEPLHCTEEDTWLQPRVTEHYAPGDIYHQEPDEIHYSAFDAGTVTLNDRTGDTEQARVFWPFGESWVDAKPRPATVTEVARTTECALARWTAMK